MSESHSSEFQEIGHCGGTITFHIPRDDTGRRTFSLRWAGTRDGPAGVIGVYALPQGIPVAEIQMAGIGRPWTPPPIEGCFPVLIGSDSEGRFGRQCPTCDGYWRSGGWTTFCAYCGHLDASYRFLTPAQLEYVKQYCETLAGALQTDGDQVIDMDAVAEAVGKAITKPPFYYTEESQQNQFSCDACGSFNDILGSYGYCSVCGRRNDLQELETRMKGLRERANAGNAWEDCVRDAVAAFDSLTSRYVEQLSRRVPLTSRRKALFQKRRYHDLKAVGTILKEVFDIDILKDFKTEDVEFAALMFHRRHVYEHKGGEADEKYLTDSGDTSVRPKQALRETADSVHRIANLVLRMAKNLHKGSHEILPPALNR